MQELKKKTKYNREAIHRLIYTTFEILKIS